MLVDTKTSRHKIMVKLEGQVRSVAARSIYGMEASDHSWGVWGEFLHKKVRNSILDNLYYHIINGRTHTKEGLC